jgi:HEAT repeat protein
LTLSSVPQSIPGVNDDELVRELLADPDADRWLTLVGSYVREDPWRARRLGEGLLASGSDPERAIGADLMGQVAAFDSAQAEEIANALMAALTAEVTPAVVESLIAALGHTRAEQAKDAVLGFADHADPDVRFSVAVALPAVGFDDDVVAALRRLSADENADVRDWATFGLSQSGSSDPETIDALIARVGDPDDDTRAEAILGLARLHHPSARGHIEREMRRETYGSLIDEALDELNHTGART